MTEGFGGHDGRSGAGAPSGHSAEPEPARAVSSAGAASTPNAELPGRLRRAVLDCSGHEPSLSVLGRAADEAADYIEQTNKALEEAVYAVRAALKRHRGEP